MSRIAGSFVGMPGSAGSCGSRQQAWDSLRLVDIGQTRDAMSAGADRQAAHAQYQLDRAACLSGQSHQVRSICLREAGAALQEALRGGLANAPGSYEQNRAARCNPLPADLREDCQRRMRGEGTTSGSVEQGGILRELRTIVPAQ